MKNKKIRTLLVLLGNFVLLFALYQLLLQLQLTIGTILYIVAAGVLLIAYCAINGGFSRPDIGEEDLPSDWSPSEKCAFLDEAKARHKKANKLLYWLLPLILVIAIDFIGLFFSDFIRQVFSA